MTNKVRPGHFIYVPRIGNVSIASITADGQAAAVNPLGRPTETLNVLLTGSTLLDHSPVPLHWDRPVYTQDGRRWVFNEHGYGRGAEHVPTPDYEQHKGRQMWYGWVTDDPEDHSKNGGWWYEDGTPARPRDCDREVATVRLTNVPPLAEVGDAIVYMAEPGATHVWDGKRGTVTSVGRQEAAFVLFEGGDRPVELTRARLHPDYSAPKDQLPPLDPTGKIVARIGSREDREFVVLGVFSPLDGKGADQIAGYIVNNTAADPEHILFVDMVTGRAVPRHGRDNLASAVEFVQVPDIATHREMALTPFGPVLLDFTTTDGEITDVSLARD